MQHRSDVCSMIQAVQVWHVFVLALLLGVVNSFDIDPFVALLTGG